MRQGKTISSCFFQSCDVDIFRGPTTHIGGIWRDRQRFDDFSVHGGSGKEVFFSTKMHGQSTISNRRISSTACKRRHPKAAVVYACGCSNNVHRTVNTNRRERKKKKTQRVTSLHEYMFLCMCRRMAPGRLS